MVTSLSWASDGSYLAVGNESGNVEIWDVDTAKRMRNMTGHLVRDESFLATSPRALFAHLDHVGVLTRDRPEFPRCRGTDPWFRLDAGTDRSGITTSGFRITRSKSFPVIVPKYVGWLGGGMVSFWLRGGPIMWSTVGSQSFRSHAMHLERLLIWDPGLGSGRVGQSIITSESSLPSTGPKWQKHNHTAAVKASRLDSSRKKKDAD